jgi:hypothetical protein
MPRNRLASGKRIELPCPDPSVKLCLAQWMGVISVNDIRFLSDESLHTLYGCIREQVALDIRSGSQHRFMGETAKQQAQRLGEEMDRRRLRFELIEW